MKFNLLCALAILVVPDASNAKFAAVQQNVMSNGFSNQFKVVANRAPNTIKNFFKTQANAIGKPQIFKTQASKVGFAAQANFQNQAVASPLTEQPIGMVQNAKNSIINGIKNFAQKPINKIAPSSIVGASNNIAAAASNNIGFAGINNVGFAGVNNVPKNIAQNNIQNFAGIQGIQTEAAPAVNSIKANVNPINNAINKPIHNAAYQNAINENVVANNAPKAAAWSQPASNNAINNIAANNGINNVGINKGFNNIAVNNGAINNAANNIINKEGSSLGVNVAEQANKVPFGFAAV